MGQGQLRVGLERVVNVQALDAGPQPERQPHRLGLHPGTQCEELLDDAELLSDRDARRQARLLETSTAELMPGAGENPSPNTSSLGRSEPPNCGMFTLWA